MKFRVGTSILLLLQARAPATAFSSPLSSSSSSHWFRSTGVKLSPTTFVVRGGSSIGSSGDGNSSNNHKIECRATISPEETSKIDNTNNSNNNQEDDTTATTTAIKEQIKNAAIGAINITGPSTFIDDFGGISFVNTSKLNSSSSSQKQKQHRVLFVLGGPGAGKGTQSANIVSEYKCIHLSVGELLRKERLRGDKSPHAELIEKCLVAGQIVPVEISLGLVRNAMDEAVSDASAEAGEEEGEHETDSSQYGQPIFLVDGFPRNYDNLSGWTNNMPNYATCLGSLVYDCSMDVLEKRILSRAETSGRSDDNLESARKRFKTFQDQTMPVVNALEEVEKMQIMGKDDDGNGIGKLHIQHIVGEGTVEEVWDATKNAMNGYVMNDVLSANALLLRAIEERDIPMYTSLTSSEMLSILPDDNHDNNKEITIKGGDDSTTTIEDVFKLYEVMGDSLDDDNDTVNRINNAQIEISTGTKAVVSYDRRVQDKVSGKVRSEFRETRVWSHERNGWVCIHFIRKPLSES